MSSDAREAVSEHADVLDVLDVLDVSEASVSEAPESEPDDESEPHDESEPDEERAASRSRSRSRRSASTRCRAMAVAGAAAVEASGGPAISFPLGRGTADAADPDGLLPGFEESVSELERDFAARGLGKRDLVALSGGHTLGIARGSGPFVAEPNAFGNDYFKNLLWFVERRELGLPTKLGPPEKPNFQLQSDVALLDDPETKKIVLEFASDRGAFFARVDQRQQPAAEYLVVACSDEVVGDRHRQHQAFGLAVFGY